MLSKLTPQPRSKALDQVSLCSAPFSPPWPEWWAAVSLSAIPNSSLWLLVALLAHLRCSFSLSVSSLPPLPLQCLTPSKLSANPRRELPHGSTRKSAALTPACLTSTTKTCALLSAPVTQLPTPTAMLILLNLTSLSKAAPRMLHHQMVPHPLFWLLAAFKVSEPLLIA